MRSPMATKAMKEDPMTKTTRKDLDSQGATASDSASTGQAPGRTLDEVAELMRTRALLREGRTYDAEMTLSPWRFDAERGLLLSDFDCPHGPIEVASLRFTVDGRGTAWLRNHLGELLDGYAAALDEAGRLRRDLAVRDLEIARVRDRFQAAAGRLEALEVRLEALEVRIGTLKAARVRGSSVDDAVQRGVEQSRAGSPRPAGAAPGLRSSSPPGVLLDHRWRVAPPTPDEVRRCSWWWNQSEAGQLHILQLDCGPSDDSIFDANELVILGPPLPIRFSDWPGQWAPCLTPDQAESEVARFERIAQRNAQERDGAQAEVGRLRSLIDQPHAGEFLEAVRLEAAHQVERWGAWHDAGKDHAGWHSLVATLLAKSTQAYWAGDGDKRTHHLVSAAAALLVWHRHVTGDRPGAGSATPASRRDPAAPSPAPALDSLGLDPPTPAPVDEGEGRLQDVFSGIVELTARQRSFVSYLLGSSYMGGDPVPEAGNRREFYRRLVRSLLGPLRLTQMVSPDGSRLVPVTRVAEDADDQHPRTAGTATSSKNTDPGIPGNGD